MKHGFRVAIGGLTHDDAVEAIAGLVDARLKQWAEDNKMCISE